MIEMLYLLFAISGAYSSYEALNCMTYTCQTLDPTQCISRTSSSEGLQNCYDATKFCNTTTGLCENLVAPPHYPGEKCSATCANGTCVNGTCVGKKYNEACTDSLECSPGLYCNKVCTYQLGLTKTCTSNEGCINSALCNIDELTTTGKCVEYGSLGVNSRASDCTVDSGMLGVSYMCMSGACSLDTLKCMAAPTSYRAPPNTCKVENDCTGTFNEMNIYSQCKCGYNPTGSSYCMPFIGDSQGVQYLAVLKQALAASVGKCNTKRRNTEDCFRTIGWYYKVATARSDYKYFPYTQNAPDCVRYVYSSYFNTTKTITTEFNSNFI